MCKIIINHSQIIKLKKEIEHRVPIRILIEILFIYFKIKICVFDFLYFNYEIIFFVNIIVNQKIKPKIIKTFF